MNTIIPRLLKTHTSANNANVYTPTFVNQSGLDIGVNDTGVGYYTDTWFGVHNPGGSAITITVWTASQGTSGSGVSVRINAGETFYAVIAKLTVASDVTLIGTPTMGSR